MDDKSLELIICPKCGSQDYFENIPAPGLSICAKCGQEITLIHLREMPFEEIIQQPCPFCGKEGEEDDTLLEEENILVYKCKRCGTLDGYRIALDPPHGPEILLGPLLTKRDKKPKPVSLYKLEKGSIVYSAKDAKRFAKLLKKAENDPKEKGKRFLRQWVKQRIGIIKNTGVSTQTIKEAKRRVEYFVDKEGKQTNKRLIIIFLATIYLLHNKESSQKITERTIQNTFGVDRKTIRKWKKTLKEDRIPLRVIVWAHRTENDSEVLQAEIPKELKSVMRVEKPQKGKCDLIGHVKLLNWRLNYVNGLWSGICEDCYEMLKRFSLKEEWEIKKFFE